MKAPVENIQVEIVDKGVARVTVRVGAYPQAGKHWREQLTGANAKKWGRIYCDPSGVEKDKRRREHMSDYGAVIEDKYTKKHGKGHINRDECPGAMFIWQTQAPADVEELCATDNQNLGRDLYWALKRVLGKLDWWEVQFRFRD